MSCSTSGAMVGTIWKALAPVPMTATALAVQVGAVDPLRRVHRQSFERVAPRDVGEFRAVELAHRADQGVGLEGLGGADPVARDRADLDEPACRLVVPAGAHHLGAEADVVGDAVLLHAALEVALQLGLLGEELGPAVVGGERVAVEVVAHVDPAAGEAVLVPGAADPRVLLDDRVGDAGLSQADAGEHPRHPGPDDHHAEGRLRLGGHRVERRHPPGVGPVELELLEHQRHVLVGDLLRHEEVHHLVHDLGRGRGREHAPPSR